MIAFTGEWSEPRPATPREETAPSAVDQYQMIVERVRVESQQISELQKRMFSVDSFFTEVDMQYLMTLQQSVMQCKRAVERLKALAPTGPPVAIPRPQPRYLGQQDPDLEQHLNPVAR